MPKQPELGCRAREFHEPDLRLADLLRDYHLRQPMEG